ncbi:hypothetical protein CDAR_395911 [Caerostris darwini]|uniref:Uncharacterized protein n=1 Tax=Caerostris darwini TaxID=1538125 RepID=A0AAV4QPH7_9ARAC|nr:hypothetical protein CDAR_395911 [Caerostris darwini]
MPKSIGGRDQFGSNTLDIRSWGVQLKSEKPNEQKVSILKELVRLINIRAGPLGRRTWGTQSQKPIEQNIYIKSFGGLKAIWWLMN